MRHPEKVLFSWKPEIPIKEFECAIITDATEIPSQAFAVFVTVRDASGGKLTPTDRSWLFSKSRSKYFQYSPSVSESGTFLLKPWVCEHYITSVDIEIMAWDRNAVAPNVLSSAVSEVATQRGAPHRWSLLEMNGANS